MRKKKKGARHSPKYRAPTEQKKRVSRNPTKRRPYATFEEMGKEKQAVHTTMRSENTTNQTRNGTERTHRGDRHINATRKKAKSGILNTFKGSMPEFGTVLGTKDENYKESLENLQECAFQ